MSDEILEIWNRAGKCAEAELIYGGGWMRAAYGTWWGRILLSLFLTRAWFSRFYGFFQNVWWSRGKIPGFVEKFGVRLDEFEDRKFRSFNDFFTRKFRPGARTFVSDPKRLPAPCEGRYLVYPFVYAGSELPVKGVWIDVDELVGSKEWVETFHGGPAFIARLCPVDYHRFHFPDNGKILDSYRLRGGLHSVNPLALAEKPNVLFTNERTVTILETENFGRLAYIEVGAMMVGKIVQTHKDREFRRGEEKGYFLFGASTVIVLGTKGSFMFDSDLLLRSGQGVECFVRLGEGIAAAHDKPR